jgi:hypothetical protein
MGEERAVEHAFSLASSKRVWSGSPLLIVIAFGALAAPHGA